MRENLFDLHVAPFVKKRATPREWKIPFLKKYFARFYRAILNSGP